MVKMTPRHPRWPEFYAKLEGPDGCNFKDDPVSGITWECESDLTTAEHVLKLMDFDDTFIERSLEFFRAHGGHCSCEVLFNVENNVQAGVSRLSLRP